MDRNKQIKDLFNQGYDMKLINQIKKAYELGFVETLNLKPNSDIYNVRRMVNAFEKYYKDDSIMCQKRLVELMNMNVNPDIFLEKEHTTDFLTALFDDVEFDEDYSVYLTGIDENDYSFSQIAFLKRLRMIECFKKLSKQDIEKLLKNYDFQNENGMRELNSENGYEYAKYAMDGFSLKESRALLYIRQDYGEKEFLEIYNELKDKLKEFEYGETVFKDIFDDCKKYGIEKCKKILNLDFKEDKIPLLNNCNSVNFDYINEFKNNNRLNNFKGKTIDVMKLMNNSTNDFLSYFKQEVENNKQVCTMDLYYIALGIKENIDINLYISNGKNDVKKTIEKEFIKNILVFNKNNPTNPIDLDFVLDKDYNLLETFDICSLNEFLSKNININYLLNLDTEYLNAILDGLYKKFNVPIEQIIPYCDEVSDPQDIISIMSLLSKGFNVLSEKDLYKESFNIYKKIESVKEYDDFCKYIIDEKLNEDNIFVLIQSLTNYIKSSDILQEMYKNNILRNKFYKIDEQLTADKLKVIFDAYDKNIYLAGKLNNQYSLEQIKMYVKINEKAKDLSKLNKRNRFLIPSNLRKIYNKNYSVEKLEIIKDNIDKSYMNKSITQDRTVDECLFYLDVNSKMNSFDKKIEEQDEFLNEKLTQKTKEYYLNMNSRLSIEEQKDKFKSFQIDMLQEYAEDIGDMDLKLYFYELINKLQKEDIINNDEIQKDI